MRNVARVTPLECESNDPPGPARSGRRMASLHLLVLLVALFAPFHLQVKATPAPGHQPTDPDWTLGTNPPPARVVPGQFVVCFRTVVSSSAAGLAGSAPDLGPGIGSVHWLRGRAPSGAALAGTTGPGSVFDRLALVASDGSSSDSDLLARLAHHPSLASVEPNTVLTLCDDVPARFPNDFYFTELWNLHNSGANEGTTGADVSAPEAWAVTTGEESVTVAVIDTGIDFFHPDLEANIWINQAEIPGNGIDDDHNGYVDDVHGYDFVNDDSDPMDDQLHGTHVSGTIGAVGDNELGVCGLCWHVRLMAIKAFNESGEGTLFDVLAAIRYAADNGARVLNASWGQPDKSAALGAAIAEAHQRGLVIVAAAGNNRSTTLSYPAAYPESVTVAATNNRDQRSLFSSYGPVVDLAAPGESVLSTIPDNRFDIASGTSMAAPHVSGAVALVFSRHPEFSNTEAEDVIRNAVDPVGGTDYIGLGRLNAAKAVKTDVPLPTARLAIPAILSGRVDLPGSALGSRFAEYILEYGQGVYPTNWSRLHSSRTPVSQGALLANWPTDSLAEGSYVLQLRVRDMEGREAIDRATFTIRNVMLTSPLHNDILRAGETVAIRGTVFGPGRTYTLAYGVGRWPSVWLTNGLTLTHEGRDQVVNGVLGTWDTRVANSNEFYTIRLTASAGNTVVGTWYEALLHLDSRLKPGWPLALMSPTTYVTNDWRQVTVADLDGDGRKEIAVVEPGEPGSQPPRLRVFDADGRPRWSRDLPDGGTSTGDVITVGDLDGDGRLELFVDVAEGGLIAAFDCTGQPLGGHWPAQVGGLNLGKTVADLDRDGVPELIAYGAVAGPDQSTTSLLAVVNADGSVRQRWTFPGAVPRLDTPRAFAAVGDLDDDPELEIVAIVRGTDVAMFDLREPSGPVWRTGTEGSLYGSPVIGDITGDHRGNIIVGAYDSRTAGKPGTHGGIYVFDRTGRVLPGWPVLNDQSFPATPALADVDGDGLQDIVAVNWERKLLHVLRADGFELPGWPVGPILANDFGPTPMTGWAKSAPVVGDLDGDGHPDIVLVTPGLQNQAAVAADPTLFGGVKAWTAGGQPIDLNPRRDFSALVMEASSGNRWKAAPPVLTDLDGNGRLDVVATTIEDVGFPGDGSGNVVKGRFTVYAWELDTRADSLATMWPMVQHDPQHTGWLPTTKAPNQPPVIGAIPNQTVRTGTPFFPIELDRYVEDPDNGPASLTWQIEGASQLRASVTANRVLVITPLNPDWSGAETLRITVRDPGGLQATTEAVYAARPDYEPPVANPDEYELAEDEEADLTPLANDVHPRGLPLSLLQVSRAHAGRLTVVGSHVRYRPATNTFGDDSFVYIVGDGRDGMALGTVTLHVRPMPDPPEAVEDFAITTKNAPVLIDVLANDTDPDGDTVQLVSVEAPAFGSATATAGSQVLYQPKPHWSGADHFSYRITDGHGGEATGTINVQVKPVNEPPVVQDLAFSLNRNTSQDLTFAGTDPDGDELTYSVLDGPAHGELFVSPKVATYYPRKGYAGTDEFTYFASDGEHASLAATVRFTILDRNNPPAAQGQELVTKNNRPLTWWLAASDPDDDFLSFVLAQPPLHGEVNLIGSNFVYQPSPGYLGPDQFSFAASDGQATSLPALLSLRLTDTNSAPVAASYGLTLPWNVPSPILLQASDGEHDPLTFTIVTNPAHGRITGTGTNVIYTPQTNYYGPDRFAFVANDGEAASAPGLVRLSVIPPNHAPETGGQALLVTQDTPRSFLIAVADVDGDPLRTVILKGPKHGRVYGLGTNYTYAPAAGFLGGDSFTFRVWDGRAYSVVATVNVNVLAAPPPKPPTFEAIKALEDGGIQLRIASTPGTRIELQVSSDLRQWKVLSSLVPTLETLTLTDTNKPPAARRFYRVVKP